MSLPWFKFFPSSWQSDQMLRICSFAARGLWVEMLGIMHVAETRGYLVVNGRKISDEQLASLAGGSPKEVKSLLAELEGAGVFSRSVDGTIFSRRMVRDHSKSIRDKANGKGGGNPNLITKDKGDVNRNEARGLTPEPTLNNTRAPATQNLEVRQESHPGSEVLDERSQYADPHAPGLERPPLGPVAVAALASIRGGKQ